MASKMENLVSSGTLEPGNQNIRFDSDRVHGMLVGVMLGDALGHPHEFRYQTDVYTGKLQYEAKHQSRFQGTKYAVVGQYTDDTEMTLALAHSLVRKNGYNRDDVILSYQHWANSNATGMGVNTRSLFKGVKTVKGFWSRHAKGMVGKLSGAKSPLTEARSNGSLMRCSPLSLLNDYDSVIQDVNLTNPTAVNQDCALLYITALRFLHQGYQPLAVYQAVKGAAQTDEVKEAFRMIDTQIKRDITKLKGYVVHSFYCAMLTLVMLQLNKTYAEIMDYLIRLGGDTDTNAAIAGAIVGSYLGFDKMMEEEITKQNYDIVMSMDPSEGGCPVDDRYLPFNVKLLAEQLVEI